ncbi:MAG: hypothetical protein ACO24Y_00145 [Hylemonella sp.]
MTLADWANLSQIVGSVAVVASLIFVGIQVHQNTRATKATALQMNADYWLIYFKMLADGELAKVYSKGAQGKEKMNSLEFHQFFMLCRAAFMGCEKQHQQYLSGLLSHDAYLGYEATIREQIVAFPGVRAMWQLVRHTYGHEFATFLDAQIVGYAVHANGSIRSQWHERVRASSSTAPDLPT